MSAPSPLSPSAPASPGSAPSPDAAPLGEIGADLAALLPGLRVVAGNPDETELAAVVAIGLAAGEALAAAEEDDQPAHPAAEWRGRARGGAARKARVAGTSSDAWRWSLHP